MRRRMMLALLTLIACGPIVPAAQTTSPRPPPPAADRKPGDYPLGPDSLPQDGVPKGKLEGPFLFRSQVIANTVRRYWIYVPVAVHRRSARERPRVPGRPACDEPDGIAASASGPART